MTAILALTCDNEASPRDAANVTEGSDPPIRYERRRAGVSLPIEEEWRPIPGYEGYEASSLGRVRSLRRSRTVVLRPAPDKKGYGCLSLTRRTGQRGPTRKIHRLIAAAFLGPCPEGLVVRHVDGNNQNNRITNLAYGTRAENEQDKLRHGTHNHAARTHCPKGHPYDVENTRIARSGWRHCRACERVRDAGRRARRLAAATEVDR